MSAFDHRAIVLRARDRLRVRLSYTEFYFESGGKGDENTSGR